MKFFIDTANLDEIKEAQDMGILDGVTTNPSLMAKEGITGHDNIMKHYVDICNIVDGDVSAEVISTDFEGMVKEGEALAELHEQIVVKLPMIKDGVKACKYFSDKGIRTNVTLVFSPGQALLAAKAGATYVSPFIGRLDDISTDGLNLIAEIRHIPAGQDSISPNRHPEIDSCDDLIDFVCRLRKISGKPVGIKTVISSRRWLDELCEGIKARGTDSAPDFITVDGGDGGTGAAPMALMDNVGLTLREALPMLVDALTEHGLRERIKVIASGKLVVPAEVAWAYCAGADSVNSARAFMFSIGCIQAMTCNTNNCPTGITTHKPHLQHGLVPEVKAPGVKNFVEKLTKDVNMIAHSCGVEHARGLRRCNVRIVQSNGRSVAMDEIYPDKTPKSYA